MSHICHLIDLHGLPARLESPLFPNALIMYVPALCAPRDAYGERLSAGKACVPSLTLLAPSEEWGPLEVGKQQQQQYM